MYQYVLCGLRVESDLAFPELTPWDGPSDAPIEIEFCLAPVEPLRDPDETRSKFEVREQGTIVFLIRGVGRVMIDQGRRVLFDAFADVDPLAIRTNFIGIIQALLWHQRGYLPLHGSAVLVGDRAIAVAGASAAGKSVTAAALTHRGHALIADDFTVIDWTRKPPVVLPAYQKLRLRQDVCDRLDLLGRALAEAHPSEKKYVLATKAAPPHESVPITDILILADERGSEFAAETLGLAQGVQNLLACVHMLEPAYALGLQKQIFSAINVIVAEVQLWRIVVPDGLDRLGETADSIAALVSR
jgi:hypothetical protein